MDGTGARQRAILTPKKSRGVGQSGEAEANVGQDGACCMRPEQRRKKRE